MHENMPSEDEWVVVDWSYHTATARSDVGKQAICFRVVAKRFEVEVIL
jgi:hypothetical protein